MYIVATFYRFKPIEDPSLARQSLLQKGEELKAKGLLIVSPQGVNGTIAGTSEVVDCYIGFIEELLGEKFDNIKRSQALTEPFKRIGVRLARELITFGPAEADPSVAETGTYVAPRDWNQLIERDDVLLIDTRNDYETFAGSFEGAVDPDIKTFSEFADYTEKHLCADASPRIAMFCTGGIRCEVASAYLLQKGFKEVFHLEGGILKYLEEIPEDESRWRGECFVFDQRVTVDHSLRKGSHQLCNACSWPVPIADVGKYGGGATCAHCDPILSDKHRARALERWRQRQLKRQREAASHANDKTNANDNGIECQAAD